MIPRWRCPTCGREHELDRRPVEEDDAWVRCDPGCGAVWEADVGPAYVVLGLRVFPMGSTAET